MPRPLTLGSAIEKNRIASDVTFLVLIEIEVTDMVTGALSETLRFARNNEDVTYMGNVYSKAAFDFSIAESSKETTQVAISVRDPSRTVMKKVDAHEGGLGWRIRIMLVNSEALDQPADIEELVYVMGATAKGYSVEFTLGARNPLGIKFPGRTQWRDRCMWQYKGEECGYSGPLPTCDYTLEGANGCAAHNNTLRFGAFPGLRNR